MQNQEGRSCQGSEEGNRSTQECYEFKAANDMHPRNGHRLIIESNDIDDLLQDYGLFLIPIYHHLRATFPCCTRVLHEISGP